MEDKKIKNKKVDLSKLPNIVEIVGLEARHLKKGAEYTVTKDCAIILINKGVAKLK